MDQPIIEEEVEQPQQAQQPNFGAVKVEAEPKEQAMIDENAMEEEKVKEEDVKIEVKEGANGYVEEVKLGNETLFSLPPEMQ